MPAADHATTDAVGEQGVFVPLLTPFDAEGAVDLQALTALVVRVIDHGADGQAALGTTGEFADLDDDERDLVKRTAVAAACGRVPVVVGIDALSSDGACRNAARSESACADVLLALPPLFRKLDDDTLFAHFAAVATDVPVLSDIPTFVGARLSPQLVRRIALELPQVVGIKLTVQEFAAVSAVLAAVKPKRPDFTSRSVRRTRRCLRCSTAASEPSAAWQTSPHPRCASWSMWRAAVIWATAVAAHREVLRLFPVYFQANPPVLALELLSAAPASPSAPPSAPPTLPIPLPCSRCATGSRACPAAAAAAIR